MSVPPPSLAAASPEQLHELAARLQLEVIRIRDVAHGSRMRARADQLERRARDLRRLAGDRRRAEGGAHGSPSSEATGPNMGTAAAAEDQSIKSTWLTTAAAAARLEIARCTLDEMFARAPKNLPGSPMQIGIGRRRQHLRWDADRLEEWLAAFRSWSTEPRRRPKRRDRRAAPGPTSAEAQRRKPSLLAMVTEDPPKRRPR